MPSVLVVDDLASDRKLMGHYLQPNPDLAVEYAADGAQALTMLETAVPDVVITDLQMPEMDGLELVQTIRTKYDHLPVVLVTAHGSEKIAHEALQHGAASYVPKEAMAERLLPTVQEILALGRTEPRRQHLGQCVQRIEVEYELDNDPTLIPPLVDEVVQKLSEIGQCDTATRIRIGVALQEALSNALYRGNLEVSRRQPGDTSPKSLGGVDVALAERRRASSPYCDRRIQVTAVISPKDAKFVVTDGGLGFDPTLIPGPQTPECISGPGGRGLVLMQSFMDKVKFNSLGNSVTMSVRLKHRPPANQPRQVSAPASRLFAVEREDDALIIVPTGNLMILTEESAQTELADLLDEWTQAETRHIVIDFGHVSHFGSTMLTAMSVLREHVASRSGSVAVCNLSNVAKEVFEIARLDTWKICSSRRAALRAVTK